MLKILGIVVHRWKQWTAGHLPFLVPKKRGGIHHMLLSVVFVALALAVRFSIAPVDAGMQYVVFFPAVTLAALAGGFKPGLLATLMGAFLATYFFTFPYYSISTEALQRALGGNLVFFMDGLVVSFAIEAMHRYRKQLAEELKESIDVNSVLAESMQHLKSIIDNQFALVVLLDTHGVILEANQAAFDWSGYRREDVINHYFYDLPCWSYDETVQEQLKAAMDAASQGQTVRYDATVKIDDDLFVVDFQISPVRNQEGCIVGLLPMAIDISSRIKAEEALKRYQAQLRTFISQAPIAIAMFDRHMNYLKTSGRWLQDFGRGYADLKGRNHYQVYPDLPEKWKQVHQQCLNGALLKNDEDLWIQADDSKRWLHWSVMPWIDENDAIGGLIMSAEDITERKQNEAHLAEQAVQLQDAARRKDEFLAMLAHELRNPLAPIRNAVEIQKLANSDPSRLAWCNEIIERQVKHLTRLVDDLLDVSRISRGLVELKKESLEIRDFILPAVETCQPLIDTRRHTFSLALPPESVWVEGDRVRLAQVVSNLINNAAKYTEEGGHIELSVEASSREVDIHVSDNGSGIDPADLAHLFDLFYQAGPQP